MDFMNLLYGNNGLNLSRTRVSYFEQNAQDTMQHMVSPALKHVLAVMATRYPRLLLPLYNHLNETHGLLMGFLHHQALSSTDSSFSENFYGLKRVRANGEEIARLSSSDKWIALACLVLIPYLKAKLDETHEKLAPSDLQNLPFRMLQDDDDEGRSDHEGEEEEEEEEAEVNHHRNRGAPADAGRPMKERVLVWVKSSFIKWYPLFHKLYQGIFLAYQIGYIYNITKYYSPLQHIAGQELRYASSADNKLFEKEFGEARQRLGDSFGRLRPLVLTVAAVMDSLKYLLPLSIFFFKFLEWWYSTEYPKHAASLKAVPPPPQALPASPDGIVVPKDHRLCPICGKKRTNPATTPTGYVFCYPCIFTRLSDSPRCPITLAPLTTDQLRKLYVTS